MFLSRAAYESLVRENARLAASCDWLSALVNQLQQERAVLLDRVLNLQLQVPEVQVRREEPPLKESDLTPDKLRAMAERFAPMPEGAKGTVFRPAPPAESAGAAEAQNAMALFSDMGDEAALRNGVSWNANGEVEFTR